MRSIKTPYKYVMGKLIDCYGREFEHDETVLITKTGKRKTTGRRTYAVKLKIEGGDHAE